MQGIKHQRLLTIYCLKKLFLFFFIRGPHGKKGRLHPKEFSHDDYYDCYLCPENHMLTYRTTNRQVYREYQSQPEDCLTYPLLS